MRNLFSYLLYVKSVLWDTSCAKIKTQKEKGVLIMAFKIGFTAETEKEDKRTFENIPVPKEPTIIKKSVVDVYFLDRNLTCSYYNDMFNLKRGDIVYVEGKLEHDCDYSFAPFVVL
jgi:hypothetical protein